MGLGGRAGRVARESTSISAAKSTTKSTSKSDLRSASKCADLRPDLRADLKADLRADLRADLKVDFNSDFDADFDSDFDADFEADFCADCSQAARKVPFLVKNACVVGGSFLAGAMEHFGSSCFCLGGLGGGSDRTQTLQCRSRF